VWLFQEGELVSIDCLFRMRYKQPFSININVTDTLAVIPPFATITTSVVTGTPSGASVGTPSGAIDTSVGNNLIVTGASVVATGTSVVTPSSQLVPPLVPPQS